MSLTIGSLCSGAGMLDEGVRAVLGGKVVWHAEHEPATEKIPKPTQAAARLLAHRYPDVPNLGDLSTVQWGVIPRVDVLTAGYPCQPDSAAGKRLSEDDDRWIFPDIARAIGVLRPRLVVLENVAGHFVRGFRTVLGTLAALGFDADWTLVRASDVGATHRRERLFVAAWPTQDADGTARGERWIAAPGQEARGRARADTGRPDRVRTTADADGDGLALVGRQLASQCDADGRSSAHTTWGPYQPAIRRWERILGRVAPPPTETSSRGGQRLSPRFTEWMMGWPDGWVTDVPGITRNEALRICGNGVVPQQAASALRELVASIGVAA